MTPAQPSSEAGPARETDETDVSVSESERGTPVAPTELPSEARPADEERETDTTPGESEQQTPAILIVGTMTVMGALLAGPGWYLLQKSRTIIGLILLGIFFLAFHSMNTMTKGEPGKFWKFLLGFVAAVVSARLVCALLASVFGVS